MTYKYDFLKFIDSPDIRAYNVRTEFTPAEQAVLITMSIKTTVEEKLSALKYLLNTYSEEEFGTNTVIGCDRLKRTGISFKEAVQNKVKIWEDVLCKRHDNRNVVVYAVFFNEQGFAKDYIGHARFFTTYDKAYQYLRERKREYIEDGELEGVLIFGRILQIPVDFEEDWRDCNEFRFNNDLQLVEIMESTRIYHTDVDVHVPDIIEAFYIHVPSPWKAGDLVKEVSPYFGNHFGIVRSDFPEKKDDWRVVSSIGDASDMRLVLDIYDSETRTWDYRDAVKVLSVETCTEEEKKKYQCMIDEWKKFMKLNAEDKQYVYAENTVSEIRVWLNNRREYLHLLDLSDRNRDIITKFLEGERYSDIASQYSLSPSRVRSVVVGFKMKVAVQERRKHREVIEIEKY